MSKLIIHNQSDLSMEDCLELVNGVIALGRISNNNKQYCYAVATKVNDKEYSIYSKLNKSSDSFIVQNTR